MASLQASKIGGHTYWRIVESRRVNGKPRPIPILYLGRANDLLARLQGLLKLEVHSLAHGAVGALWTLASELGVSSIIDRHMMASGRRSRKTGAEVVGLPPHRSDGLTVGQSLVLVAIGRACKATSKRGFAEWAATTTLGEMANVDVQRLDSQHFWDQMDQLPVANIAAIERDIVAAAVEQFKLPLDTLLYDATNFYTFIASTNLRPKLPARGKNKQKRSDLRQVSVAMLCSRQDGFPLWHQTYAGQMSDARSFEQALPLIKERLLGLRSGLESLTLVFDKGNVSRANQLRVDDAKLHYVTGLTVVSQKKLVETANRKMSSVVLDEEETLLAYRTQRTIWGGQRTAVVLISESLKEGQIRGILQHVDSAQKWLTRLADTLRRGRQKRSRAAIERDIDNRLNGRQHLRHVLKYQLAGEDPKLTLTYQFDPQALERLTSETLGRLVLITDRKEWTTAEIIRAYRSQSNVEALFAHLKDPIHVALRPQYHWTDQKLHVHVFTCVLAHMLATLLFLKAKRANVGLRSQEHLLTALQAVRKATIIQRDGPKKKPRVTRQLENIPTALAPHLVQLGVID